MNDINLLLHKVRNGDVAAGAIVVSMYGRRLVHYLRAIAPDISDVDREIVAERSIESAIANIDRYEPELGTFDSWLRGYVRRKLLEFYRTRPDRVPSDAFGADGWSLEDTERPPPAPEIIADVAAALRELSPSDQLIISLRDINGLSFQEIADRLSVSVEACRQRHRRALISLRQKLPLEPASGQDDTPTTSTTA